MSKRDWQRVNDENLVRQRAQAWAPLDTLGTLETCWCGQEYAHYWPGQEDGAPHPKAKEEETEK